MKRALLTVLFGVSLLTPLPTMGDDALKSTETMPAVRNSKYDIECRFLGKRHGARVETVVLADHQGKILSRTTIGQDMTDPELMWSPDGDFLVIPIGAGGFHVVRIGRDGEALTIIEHELHFFFKSSDGLEHRAIQQMAQWTKGSEFLFLAEHENYSAQCEFDLKSGELKTFGEDLIYARMGTKTIQGKSIPTKGRWRVEKMPSK